MFRSRGENLRAVFILLFLNIAFFILEHQDAKKFSMLFRFDLEKVRAGEVWRLFTYQFTQAGTGFMEALSLFVTLLLLYMMGSALEEEWGSFHFVALFVVSALGSAAVAAFLGIPLMGSYFVYFTLLFVYASAFRQQTFYLFGLIPVRVQFLALFSFAVLLYGVFAGGLSNLAALGGAIAAYVYYLTQRVQIVFVSSQQATDDVPRVKIDTTAIHNGARYAAMRQALAAGNDAEIERLTGACEREMIAGVNICPPADYKPENADGYCIRCEGFAECSARYLRLSRAQGNRPATAKGLSPVANPDAP